MPSLAGRSLAIRWCPTCRGRGWPLALIEGAPRLVRCCVVVQVPPASADTAHAAQRLRGQVIEDAVQASCREAACSATEYVLVAFKIVSCGCCLKVGRQTPAGSLQSMLRNRHVPSVDLSGHIIMRCQAGTLL